MNEAVKDGTLHVLDGKPVIFYDGYWIRYYAPPENSLQEKKLLIDQMTKRAFHHTEEGINTPGRKLKRAREAWESSGCGARLKARVAVLAALSTEDVVSCAAVTASRLLRISARPPLDGGRARRGGLPLP